MSDHRRTLGQFETPVDVADLVLAFCLRRPSDRVLDPSCGRGAFLARAERLQRWLSDDRPAQGSLWGVELDAAAVELARRSLPDAHIIHYDFFSLTPWSERLFDAVVGNPPYTRAEWFGRLAEGPAPGRQMVMFPAPEEEHDVSERVPLPAPYRVDDAILGRRAGLHAHFLVHGTAFLRVGGRFGFVVSNSWLDVAYGERLKQFLLDHYKIVAIIESDVERWFHEASINTCLIVMEKCGDLEERQAHRIRLVRLHRALADLIPYGAEDRQRLSHMERFAARLLPGESVRTQDFTVRVAGQRELSAADRWGVALRAPLVWRRPVRSGQLSPLGEWADVRRGYTSGDNKFFYLEQNEVEQWGIEASYLRPLLKSLRSVRTRRFGASECRHQVLSLAGPPPPGSAVAAYLAWGEEQGVHRRRTCAARELWYRLPDQTPALLSVAKGIWGRHFVPIASEPLWVDQQIYQIQLHDGVPVMAAAALLNSAWFGLQLELHGRTNFGEGVLWLAAYELADLLLPDPRYLPDDMVARLARAYERLVDRPVEPAAQELAQADWQLLNGLVYELLGLSRADGTAIEEALAERIEARHRKAADGHE
jgi:hypothetical protein